MDKTRKKDGDYNNLFKKVNHNFETDIWLKAINEFISHYSQKPGMRIVYNEFLQTKLLSVNHFEKCFFKPSKSDSHLVLINFYIILLEHFETSNKTKIQIQKNLYFHLQSQNRESPLMPILKSILEKDYNLIKVILNIIVNENLDHKEADKISNDSENQIADEIKKDNSKKATHIYLIEYGMAVVSCFCSENKYLLDKLIIELEIKNTMDFIFSSNFQNEKIILQYCSMIYTLCSVEDHQDFVSSNLALNVMMLIEWVKLKLFEIIENTGRKRQIDYQGKVAANRSILYPISENYDEYLQILNLLIDITWKLVRKDDFVYTFIVNHKFRTFVQIFKSMQAGSSSNDSLRIKIIQILFSITAVKDSYSKNTVDKISEIDGEIFKQIFDFVSQEFQVSLEFDVNDEWYKVFPSKRNELRQTPNIYLKINQDADNMTLNLIENTLGFLNYNLPKYKDFIKMLTTDATKEKHENPINILTEKFINIKEMIKQSHHYEQIKKSYTKPMIQINNISKCTSKMKKFIEKKINKVE